MYILLSTYLLEQTNLISKDSKTLRQSIGIPHSFSPLPPRALFRTEVRRVGRWVWRVRRLSKAISRIPFNKRKISYPVFLYKAGVPRLVQ